MYPQVFGKYVLERELARGGMARVSLATLRGAGGFEKKLVVKQIRDELAYEEFIKRFVEEAKTTVALSHPNIVPVYELGVELGTYYLAMEFVEGVSVAELLRAGQREEKPVLSPEEGAYVGVEICRALDYAHRRMKMVHRDITPRNVMIDEEGQVKVIDFGIAAPADVEGHEVFGSPGHMPPEQAEGKELTAATDVFAVAVLLLEVWSGKAPFRRKDPKESADAMRGPRPVPSAIDVRLLPLDDVIQRSLSLEPSARPQEADELGRALRKFLAGVDVHDVARALGTRVRDLRAKPVAPVENKRVGLQRPPSRPSAAEIRTKTFAARDVVIEWDRPSGSTRKLAPSDPPPPPPSSEQTANKPEAETIATRPIETDKKVLSQKPPPRRSSVLPFAAVVVVAALGGFFVARAFKGATSDAPPASAAVSTTSSAPTITASNPSSIPSATDRPPATASVVATTSAPSATTSSTPSASAVVAKATLVLGGDPGTTVAIDGVPRGACPTTLSVDPGVHTVTFVFGKTGEALSQGVDLKPGGKLVMRADFTGAKPMIRMGG
jgi:serine/threonine-protein kinase